MTPATFKYRVMQQWLYLSLPTLLVLYTFDSVQFSNRTPLPLICQELTTMPLMPCGDVPSTKYQDSVYGQTSNGLGSLNQPYLPEKHRDWDLVLLIHLNLTPLRKAQPSTFCMQVCTAGQSPNLTFWRSQINAVLLTEVDGEDGMRGSMIAEPVRAISRCGSINADHEIPIQEDLRWE